MRWVSKSHAALPWLGICDFFWQVWSMTTLTFHRLTNHVFLWVWKTAGCWKLFEIHRFNKWIQSVLRPIMQKWHFMTAIGYSGSVGMPAWRVTQVPSILYGNFLNTQTWTFLRCSVSLSISGLHLYTFKPSLSLGLRKVMCVDSDSERSGIYRDEGLFPKVPRNGCAFECWSDSEPGSPRRSFFLCKPKLLSSSQGTNSGETLLGKMSTCLWLLPLNWKSRCDSLEHLGFPSPCSSSSNCLRRLQAALLLGTWSHILLGIVFRLFDLLSVWHGIFWFTSFLFNFSTPVSLSEVRGNTPMYKGTQN